MEGRGPVRPDPLPADLTLAREVADVRMPSGPGHDPQARRGFPVVGVDGSGVVDAVAERDPRSLFRVVLSRGWGIVAAALG